jgi:HK97 family phage portal protein
MSILTAIARWFGRGGPLADRRGQQLIGPSGASISDDVPPQSAELALQISTVWRCVDLLAKVIGTLPLFVYENMPNGQRDLARQSFLWLLLHDTPNARMTPAEFWGAVLLNYLLRGNGYARIERGANGEPLALWPMSADQVTPYVMDNGQVAYVYQVNSDTWVLPSEQVFHLKDIGNGTVGLGRLEFMRATVGEAVRAQAQATRLFANGNKPTGLLYIDRVLNDEQRTALRRNFADIAEGSTSRLYILEASMKYEQVSLTPQDVQLLDTRRFGVEEVCRWFGVPPVLVGHSNVTTWGSGVEQILDGFHKLTVGPLLELIEQAIMKRILTPQQRARMTVEFNFDALLRANLKDRMEIYAKGVQNAVLSRNEARQLENLPPFKGGEIFTAQTNLAPVEKLGQVPATAAPPPDPIAQ